MAGGTFTAQNKTRPGAYINVRSESIAASGEGISGVVTMPIVADFGTSQEVIEVSSATNFNQLFGEGLESDNLMLVGEALKRGATVLLYRVNGGEKATAEISASVNATAKHEGIIGNKIRVVVRESIDETDKYDVLTYLDAQLADNQSGVATVADLEDNHLVVFSGSGALAVTAGVTLEGGASAEAESGDYSDYLEAISVHEFNVMAITVAEETTKIAAANFVKRLREDEGLKCQAVAGNHPANHEGIINVTNGVVLANGKELSAAQATAFVAGATAAAGVNESLTYSPYDGAVDVTPRLKDSETVSALNAGELVFTLNKDTVVIEQDINSLTSFTVEKNQDFRKNRVLRVLDNIANNSKEVFLNNFVGRINNNEDGRALFLANRIAYFESLQDIGAIEDFVADEVSIRAGEAKDAVLMDVYIKPVDSMEKLYMTVRVQ